MARKRRKDLKINFLNSGKNFFRRIIPEETLDTEVKNSLLAVLFLAISLILLLSAFDLAGPFGKIFLRF